MSEKRIVGVDIGSYAIKIVYLDPKASDPLVLGFERERVVDAANVGSGVVSADDTTPAGPPPIPSDGSDASFEDAPTGVHEAPLDDADTGEMPPGDGSSEESADAQHVEPPQFSDVPGWVGALRRLQRRAALDGELQATAVPDGNAILIELDVPFEDKAKVRNILPHLMVDRLPLSQSEVTWDFQTYPGDARSEGARAVVGFARNTDLRELLDHLQESGADPAQLGVAELQLAAVGSFVARDTGGVTAFVDLGHELTRIAVVDGWEPLLGRTIRSAGRQITDTIRDQFGQTFAEAEEVKHQYGAILGESDDANERMKKLSAAIQDGMRPIVRDLRRTFQGLYARKRVEVDRVYICGGTSLIKNVEKYLSEQLGIPVRRMPAPAVGLGAPDIAAVSTLAFGAALSLQDEAVRSHAVNLRVGAFAYRGRSSYLRRQFIFAAAAVFALICVLGLTLYMQKLSYEAQHDAMKAALETQTEALFGTAFTDKSAIEKVMEGGEAGTNRFIPNMSAYHLLHELTVKMPKDLEITLDRIEVDTDRNLIQIYGETTDAQAVDRIVSDLEQGIECLKEIKKDKLRVRDDKADFELQISSGCS